MKPQRKEFQELLRKQNVVAVGYGKKKRWGADTGEDAIVISVSKKVPVEALDKRDVVPATIRGQKTDVQEVGGEIRLFRRFPVPPRGQAARVGTRDITARERPAHPGCSIGHKDITAGTFGAVVYDNDTGLPLILSNNHVLANVNMGDIGDAILQPGKYDGGCEPGDVIARLLKFIKIETVDTSDCPIPNMVANVFNSLAWLMRRHSRLSTYRSVTNLVDCALAQPINEKDIEPFIPDIGGVTGVAAPEVGMIVTKRGRTTERTHGKIDSTGNMVNVNMGDGKIAIFEDQMIISGTSGKFSDGGDSGSLILNTSRQAVGLLFAGNDTITIGNDISNVLKALDVSLVRNQYARK
ncbi:MAG: hypothetical protein WC455_13330 [Dehalococcoidia bacterium]|jgi:hypothetical protein